jgi:hypothetical protein
MQGYKLVGLAVAEAQAAPDLPKLSSNILDSPELPLRATALWSPALPPQGLYLNDVFFIRMSQSMSGYRPMTWILFGGCEGERLPSLIRVSVSHIRGKFNICFHYDSSELQDQELSFAYYSHTENIKHFPIDGKGGELITTLVGGAVSSTRDFWLKIATNRGRAFYFNSEHPQFRSILDPHGITQGTTIVGLFICQVYRIIRSCSSESANVPTASKRRNYRLWRDLDQGKSRARNSCCPSGNVFYLRNGKYVYCYGTKVKSVFN